MTQEQIKTKILEYKQIVSADPHAAIVVQKEVLETFSTNPFDYPCEFILETCASFDMTPNMITDDKGNFALTNIATGSIYDDLEAGTFTVSVKKSQFAPTLREALKIFLNAAIYKVNRIISGEEKFIPTEQFKKLVAEFLAEERRNDSKLASTIKPRLKTWSEIGDCLMGQRLTAETIELNPLLAEALLRGMIPITKEIAALLHSVTGNDAEYWLKLEADWQVKLEQLKSLTCHT